MRALVAAALVWVSGSSVSWAGEPRRVEVAWNELEQVVSGRKVALTLPDGTHLTGRVTAVRDDALLLDAGGPRMLPRAQVAVLRYFENKGPWHKGKFICTDGGVRVPLFVSWPGRIFASTLRAPSPWKSPWR